MTDNPRPVFDARLNVWRVETAREMAWAAAKRQQAAQRKTAEESAWASAQRLRDYRGQVGDEVDLADAVLEGLDALSRGEALPAGTRQALAKVRQIKAR
ncbi:MAG: hypothetical protein H6907_11555 [Hyphomicrobiales bacterium]|nr:hypothetical protein [Hyphomicrobiales bacterium]